LRYPGLPAIRKHSLAARQDDRRGNRFSFSFLFPFSFPCALQQFWRSKSLITTGVHPRQGAEEESAESASSSLLLSFFFSSGRACLSKESAIGAAVKIL